MRWWTWMTLAMLACSGDGGSDGGDDDDDATNGDDDDVATTPDGDVVIDCDAVPDHDGTNVLMDENLPKRAGYTHVAFAVDSIEETVRRLGELDIAISGGPERLGRGISLFVRDPDRNVLELRQERAE